MVDVVAFARVDAIGGGGGTSGTRGSTHPVKTLLVGRATVTPAVVVDVGGGGGGGGGTFYYRTVKGGHTHE